MEPDAAKAPHKKLQNDIAGIDADFGSIYVIPAPTDYVDDVDDGPIPTAPHQMLTFGPQQEKVMIIPDYRVNHVMPGVARKPLIGSDKLVKAQKVEEAPVPAPAPVDIPLPESFDPATLLSVEFRTKSQASPESPLTALEMFTGAEGIVLLDMFESWNIKTLADFTKFPETHPEGVQLLKDAEMFPDLPMFVAKIKALLANPPAVVSSPAAETSSAPQENLDLGASKVYPSSRAADTKIPVLQVPGVTDAVAAILSRYALVAYAHELIALPTKFPGIYSMLEDTGEIPNLPEILSAASRLCLGSSVVSLPSDGVPLADSMYLHKFGEAQRPQVPLKDISRNSLVGALKAMPSDLANQLAHLYPPITSLQALATFAEVNPREYAYLLREFPELSALCQEAALLVSISQGQVRKPSHPM